VTKASRFQSCESWPNSLIKFRVSNKRVFFTLCIHVVQARLLFQFKVSLQVNSLILFVLL
jgi:hypothetical protein